MSKILTKLTSLLLFVFVFGVAAKAQDNVTIDVHEGIELLSIVQFLSGQLSNTTPSQYKTDVKNYFVKHRSHPAVVKMFSYDYRIYPDLVELGWLFYDFPNIKMRPLPSELSWYKLIPKNELENYLRLCLKFYKDTNFHRFYTAHRKDYDAWGKNLREEIASKKAVEHFEKTFDLEGKVKWFICLDPLNDWGAHAIKVEKFDSAASNYIVFQQGYFGDKDAAGQPNFKVNVYDFVWHEGTHIISDPILQKYKPQIDALSSLMKEDERLKRQNITDWQNYFNELIARATSIALHKKFATQSEYETLLKRESSRGFVQVEQISEIIYNNFVNEKKVSNYADVFPMIFDALKQKYQSN